MKNNTLEWIIYFVLLLVVVFVVYDIYFKTPIIYCHFEADLLDSAFPRTECFNMKIISKDMDRLNLNQFDSLNYTSYVCSDKYKELPSCNESNLYFTYYPISLFAKPNCMNTTNCTIQYMNDTNQSICTENVICVDSKLDGFISIEYFIDYFSDNLEYRTKLEDAFMMEHYNSTKELQKRFKKFKGR